MPYWGSYPRQQPRHQPVAGLDARHHRLVFHGASADRARPARVAAAALHLQRRGAAESEPRSDSLCRAALLLELRAVADDQVGHAGRLYACLHGRLVARLPRVGGLQPQRHDADVRDAGGQRHRRGASAGYDKASRDAASHSATAIQGRRDNSRSGVRGGRPRPASDRSDSKWNRTRKCRRRRWPRGSAGCGR